MSATNRGAARAPLDFYSTPAWVTESLLAALPGKPGANFPLTPGSILDPCAGDGSILALLGDVGRGFELDPLRAFVCKERGLAVEHRDALVPGDTWGNPELVIMNPPYSLAEEFVRRALQEVRPGGTVAALLRLGFAASKKRVQFHRDFPSDFKILPQRPSFTADGKTDASEYAWFVWPGACRWTLLDPPTRPKKVKVSP